MDIINNKLKNILDWAGKGIDADEKIQLVKEERDLWRKRVDKLTAERDIWRENYNRLRVICDARPDLLGDLSPHSVLENVVTTSPDPSSI